MSSTALAATDGTSAAAALTDAEHYCHSANAATGYCYHMYMHMQEAAQELRDLLQDDKAPTWAGEPALRGHFYC
jgi:hypothetical protein